MKRLLALGVAVGAVVAVLSQPLGASVLRPRLVTICLGPAGSDDRSELRVPAPIARLLVRLHWATRGPCVVRLTCAGVPTSLGCGEVIDLDDGQIPVSELSEELEFTALGPGEPEIFIDLTSVPPRASQMGACIDDAYDQEAEVGYAWAIAKDGAIADSGAGGFARAPWEPVSPSVPMTPVQSMTIASISKPITAVATMLLLEEEPGIDLDDPFYPLIADELGGLYFLENGVLLSVPGPGVDQVTIRNLLTHRSGLKTGIGCGASKLITLLGVGVVGTPGSTEDYENSNFCLLREVIEAVSGMDYVDYVQTRVLQPMGIAASCMPQPVDPTLYYNTIQDPGKAWGDYTASCSAYGWTASAEQLALFLAGVRLDTVLTQATREQMLGDCPTAGGTDDKCLGWLRSTKVVGEHSYHNGDWYTGDFCKGTPGGLSLQPSECKKGFNGTIMRFPLGIDASLLVNTVGGTGLNPGLKSEVSILRECFKEAFLDANP